MAIKGFRPGKHPSEIEDKKKKKEFEKRQKDFNERMDKFQKEFVELSKKYKIGPGAVIDVKPQGIVPVSVWLDEKPMYEQKAKQEQENQENPKGLIT